MGFWTVFIIIIVAIVGGSALFEIVWDRNAHRLVRQYCSENSIEIISIKTWKRAYGLYYRVDGEKKYCRFEASWKELRWKPKSPTEIMAEETSMQDESAR